MTVHVIALEILTFVALIAEDFFSTAKQANSFNVQAVRIASKEDDLLEGPCKRLIH